MDMQNGSIMWKALADPKRRRIVQLLQAQPLTTGDLCQHFDVSRYAVMKHLKVLEEAGMVMTERRGRQRWNFLNVLPQEVGPAGHHAHDAEREPLFEVAQPSYYVETGANLLTRLSYTLTLEEEETTAVFHTLLHQVNHWWRVRQWPDAAVRLENHLGGRFYEQWSPTVAGQPPNGLLYGYVTLWHAPYACKIHGSFGLDDVDATLHLQVRPAGHNCQLQVTQQFWRPPTPASLAVFEQGWAEMLEAISLRMAGTIIN